MSAKPGPLVFTPEEEVRREALIKQCLCASTIEQCLAAQDAIYAWMKKYPRDFDVLDVGEQVAMTLDWAINEPD